MWKRGGRSSALDRAEALLSAARREPVQGSSAKTEGAVDRSVINRSAPTSAHTLFLDESDLSSVSSARHLGPEAAGSATDIQRRQGDSKDAGSRFLKKASSSVPKSYQSPFKSPDPRNTSSSMQDFKAAAVSRQSFKQDGQDPDPPVNHISDLRITEPEAALKASVQQSVQSSSDGSLKGRRFLKSNANIKSTNNTAARSLQGPDAIVPSVGLETKSARSVRTVSLDSDEEDMRKLLGDFSDSVNSVVTAGRATADKKLNKSRQALNSTAPAVVPPSSSTSAPPHPSSRCSSPFRFPGKAQVHFSPSVPSPTPSPPYRSQSPPGRDGDASLQDSVSSLSGCGKVLSLEELFPAGLGSDDPHSEMSEALSEDGQQDFKINVLTLDELAPAEDAVREKTADQESGTRIGVPVSRSREQLLDEQEEELQQEEEDVHNYQSDFESESRTEPDSSASQVSEHLHGQEDEEEVVSHSQASRGRTKDDYSSTFSDTSCSYNSWVSDRSQSHNGHRESRSSDSSVSHCSFSQRTRRRRSSAGKLFKEAAVQTDTLPHSRLKGGTSLGSAIGMSSTPVVTHMFSAEMVEALSTFNPTASVLHEVLKQRLALTRQFLQNSRQLRSSLLQSLGPPNYRYTTLEDTREYIQKHRAAKLTMEKAMEEVMQEMRDGV